MIHKRKNDSLFAGGHVNCRHEKCIGAGFDRSSDSLVVMDDVHLGARNDSLLSFRAWEGRRCALEVFLHCRSAVWLLDKHRRAVQLGAARLRHIELSQRRYKPTSRTRSVSTQFPGPVQLVEPTRLSGVRRRDDGHGSENEWSICRSGSPGRLLPFQV